MRAFTALLMVAAVTYAGSCVTDSDEEGDLSSTESMLDVENDQTPTGGPEAEYIPGNDTVEELGVRNSLVAEAEVAMQNELLAANQTAEHQFDLLARQTSLAFYATVTSMMARYENDIIVTDVRLRADGIVAGEASPPGVIVVTGGEVDGIRAVDTASPHLSEGNRYLVMFAADSTGKLVLIDMLPTSEDGSVIVGGFHLSAETVQAVLSAVMTGGAE